MLSSVSSAVPKRGRCLSFTEWRPQQAGYRNRFGIVELRGVATAAKKMHTIFMPLLGFDQQGYRRQGGGFMMPRWLFVAIISTYNNPV